MNSAGREFYMSRAHESRDRAWEWGVGLVFGVGVAVILIVFVVPTL